MFVLKICTENAAFDGHDRRSTEIPRILRDAADRIEQTGRVEAFTLFDHNGNAVGSTADTCPTTYDA